MNAYIMRTQIFRKIKYDLKGYSLLTMVVQGHFYVIESLQDIPKFNF